MQLGHYTNNNHGISEQAKSALDELIETEKLHNKLQTDIRQRMESWNVINA